MTAATQYDVPSRVPSPVSVVSDQAAPRARRFFEGATGRLRDLSDNLLVRFSVISFVVMATIAVALVVTLSNKVRQSALADAFEEAVGDAVGPVRSVLKPEDLLTPMTGARYDGFDRFVKESLTSDRTARVKLWSRDGTVIYSNNPAGVGEKFPQKGEVQAALLGVNSGEIKVPKDAENEHERMLGTLVEVYTPIVLPGSPEPAGVLEIYRYYAPTAMRIAEMQRWVLASVGIGFFVLYASLVSVVWSGWRTIVGQRRRLETLHAEVSRERNTLAAVQSSMSEGLVVVDAERRVVYHNSAMDAMWGIQKAEAVTTRPLADLVALRAGGNEDPQRMKEAIAEVVERSAQGPRSVEVALVRPERQDLVLTAFPINADNGRSLVGLLVRDVTEERELERRRNAFVNTASHELRTPTAAIIGFTELILQSEEVQGKCRGWLERIFNNGARLSVLVDDLLALSRIQAGRVRLRIEAVRVEAAVQPVLAEAGPTSDKHTLVLETPPSLPEVAADLTQLREVLRHLVGNAIKYSPKGGTVTVSAHHDPTRHRVVMSVADQGVGIAQEAMAHLFEPFSRIPRAETDLVRGSGLGLAIVSGLVRLMQGEVWVESEVDKGSRFYVALPAAGSSDGRRSA